MKKILLGLFLIAFISVDAQIETGKIFAGGALGINSSGSSRENISGSTTTETLGVSNFGFKIIPQIGYMITDQIGAGMGLGYDFKKVTTPDFFDNGTDQFNQVETTNSFVISPFARYYKNITDKFYLYGNFSIPILLSNDSKLMWNDNNDGTTDYDGTIKSSTFGIGLGLGANYFVSNNIALEAKFNLFNINYVSVKKTNTDKNGDGNVDNTSGFNFGLDTGNIFNTGNISIGIQIFL